MNTEDVIEIFKASVVNGDVNGAYSILEKNMKLYAKKGLKEREEFMQYLLNAMKGEITPEDLYKIYSDEKYNIFPYIRNYKGYIFSLVDTLKYAINRYNIKYPEFDAKRCNDL
ncbi:MAG: hypothetical protein AMDU4_FER2C00028G0002 [Ferroplasma sp. Type II]|jgi:hypothetical protein|uniref:hypothetical protein n=1 Tax=Ferroplasma sp. Type II TaxID=261388 RepID=UPI0003894D81|nr:hypothetical protein [Ferroplasma sp. Type II]EQB74095.1 MAG: hypothetical protein AMDU4_FER2C00028G0002 [Ferroplasma sp. Type II]HII82100.1 hypothetical protein [Ferroplasma sp.]